MSQYTEYKSLNLPNIAETVLKRWEENKVFERSVEEREGAPAYVFYEGPPSANGLPGIHHVMSRRLKIFFVGIRHKRASR
jgi:isoleucyl-tRNA synthetase